jgi:hypothetical protein
MRGRIFAVASSWIGSADFLSSSVTTASSVPSLASTFLTLPTATPAIRTGEFSRSELADSNVALTRKPCVKGMSFVKPRKVPMPMIASAISPIVSGLRLRRRRWREAAIT